MIAKVERKSLTAPDAAEYVGYALNSLAKYRRERIMNICGELTGCPTFSCAVTTAAEGMLRVAGHQ